MSFDTQCEIRADKNITAQTAPEFVEKQVCRSRCFAFSASDSGEVESSFTPLCKRCLKQCVAGGSNTSDLRFMSIPFFYFHGVCVWSRLSFGFSLIVHFEKLEAVFIYYLYSCFEKSLIDK